VADGTPMVGVLTEFAGELRRSGLPVGSGDVLTYCQAMAALDPTDLTDLYWAGRATLVTRRELITGYDEAFRRFFLGGAGPVPDVLKLRAQSAAQAAAVLEIPAAEPAGAGREQDEAMLGLMASDAEALRHKSFTACTPEELAAVAACDGIATGIGASRYGARLVVLAGSRDEAIEQASAEFTAAAARAGLPASPIVRLAPIPVAMPSHAATASASWTICSRDSRRPPCASMPTLHLTGRSFARSAG